MAKTITITLDNVEGGVYIKTDDTTFTKCFDLISLDLIKNKTSTGRHDWIRSLKGSAKLLQCKNLLKCEDLFDEEVLVKSIGDMANLWEGVFTDIKTKPNGIIKFKIEVIPINPPYPRQLA